MSFTYPMQLVEMDDGPVFGYLDKGHTNPEVFAAAIDWAWEAAIDDLGTVKHLMARWLPPNPPGENMHELQFESQPGPGVFLCTFVSRDDIHYPE